MSIMVLPYPSSQLALNLVYKYRMQKSEIGSENDDRSWPLARAHVKDGDLHKDKPISRKSG